VDLHIVNQRVDQALADNSRAERIVIFMAIAIFLIGTGIIVVAFFWSVNAYVGSGAVLFQGLLYWPIREILRLRRENLVLQTFPVLISILPTEGAVTETIKLLDYIRK